MAKVDFPMELTFATHHLQDIVVNACLERCARQATEARKKRAPKILEGFRAGITRID